MGGPPRRLERVSLGVLSWLRLVADGVAGEEVETRVGDADPVKAVEDALSDFPAEELIVITRAGEEADWLEEESGATAQNRFARPVTHLVVAEYIQLSRVADLRRGYWE